MAEVEILTSLLDLQERFGLDKIAFAFPFGAVPATFDAAMVARLEKAGLNCALTTEEAPVNQGRSPFDWGRFTVRQSDTDATLAAKLDGHYTLLRDAWRTICGR
jgi:hypothetical protein